MKFWIMIISVISVLTGCEVERTKQLKTQIKMTEREEQLVEQMKWLDVKDPLLEAEEAILNGNCKFLAGANRGGAYLPGLDSETSRPLVSNNQYRVIEGMGDFIVGRVHKDYRLKAKSYMEVYNKKLLEGCS